MAYQSRLEMVIDSRSGERSLKRLDSHLDSTERKGVSAAGAMTRVSAAIGLIAAAAGGLSFSRIIRETASFEDSMLGLQAVSRATTSQMEALEKQSRTLGATSMFSAQQAGDAQRFLAQAGFEVNEILSATPGILQLATAGQLDLARAADIASNVLGGMGLEVSELSRVNNVLAATAAGSNTSIEQLGQALSFAAPFAASAGISIEEAAASIGVMSDAGIQASRAGTGLVGVIRQLSRVTPVAEKALNQVGLSAGDVNIEAHGLEVVLERLRNAGINTGQAIEIFGSEAGAAAQVLFNGSQRVQEFTGELGAAEGAVDRMAQTIGSGLTGSMRSFSSMLSETMIRLGKDEGVAGGFQAVIDTASGVLSVYNDMLPEFAEANDLTETQAENLELMAAGLKATGAGALAIGGVTVALKAATVAQLAFNVAARANPYVLAASAIAGAAAAVWSLSDSFDEAEKRARGLKEEVDQLTSNFDGLTEAQLRNERASISRQLGEAKREAESLNRELEKVQTLVRNSGQLGPNGGALPVATAEDLARGERIKGQLEDARFEADALGQAYENAGKRLEELANKPAPSISSGGSGSGSGRSGGASDSDRPSSNQVRGDSILEGLDADARGDDIIAAQQREFEAVKRGLDEKYAAEQSHAERMQALRDGQRLGLIESQEEMNALMVASVEQRNQDLERLEQARQMVQLGAAEQMFGSLADLAKEFAGEQSGIYRAMFLTQKAAAIAQSIVAINSGIALAAANPFPANLGAMATVAGATAGLVGNIQSVNMQGQAHDGIDKVPKSGTWNLEKGERVVTAETSAKLDKKLDESGGIGGQPIEVNNIFQISAGVAGTVRAEFMKMMPMIEERSKASVLQAINNGGPMAKATGRRR